jgi:zinc transport system ATP-binding protein
MNMIEVNELGVCYRGMTVLKEVSFVVKKGDYVGIVGPNGSGKTTLMKALLGILPFSGSVYFHGKHFAEFITQHPLGYLPQKMSFLDQRFPATAKEIVLSGVYARKRFPKMLSHQDAEAADAIMNTLEISQLKDRPIGKLSGGQQQRVLLARALIQQPEILILDEPTVALDPQSREIFYETIQKLNQEQQVTILLVSHDMSSVGEFASKLLYLDRRVVFYGTFDSFCQSATMSHYFGISQHLICHRH